jgi:hypothetical protein
MLNLRNPFIFLAAISVVAPALSGLYSLIIVSAFCLVLYISVYSNWKLRIAYFLISLSATGLVLSGILSAELFTVLYCCGFLALLFPQYRAISITLAFVETPLFQQVITIAASYSPIPLGQAIPVIFCIALFSLLLSKTLFRSFLFIVSVLAVCILGWYFNIEVLLISLINSVIFGVFLLFSKDMPIKYSRNKFLTLVLIASVHSIFIWSASAKIDKNNLVVWIPESKDKFEYQFFNDYINALNLSGISAKKVTLASEIKPNSLVLMPWTTEISAQQFISDLRNTRNSKKITVLLGGEHTNYGKFADRLNPIFSNNLNFANTTTIPPDNKNYFGALWTASVLQFPLNAPLNRGASIDIFSLQAFPILIAKSIFSDLGPIEVDDFWVGDFKLGHSDPRGWAVLAAAYRDGPLWVLAGDNSFLMNRYFLPNPEPIHHIISLASLYPMLLLQITIMLFICILSCINHDFYQSNTKKYLFISLVFFFIFSIVFSTFTNHTRKEGHLLSKKLIFFGGDERSSAIAISSYAKTIDESNRKLFIHERPFSNSDIGKTGKPEVHVGHIKSDFKYNNVVISNCGVTNFENSVGAKLSFREAQFCEVTGDANIIVGNKSQATVIEIKSTPPITLILDRYFISGSPPVDANIKYILNLLSETISD